MSDTTITRYGRRGGQGGRTGIKTRTSAAGRGFLLFLEAFAALGLFLDATLSMTFTVLFAGIFLVPPITMVIRRFANRRRRLAREWQGIEIAVPYRPAPEFGEGAAGAWQRCRWIYTDPATWRDYLWTLTDPIVGLFLGILPIALMLYGVWGLVLTFAWRPFTDAGFNDWYTFVHVHGADTSRAWQTSAVGAVVLVLGVWSAPALLRLHGLWSRLLLAPTANAAMAARVEHLTVARKDVIDTQAAEIRRIERDLHDGAQARLVAMGMNLNAAAHLLEKNPDAARTLLLEARDTSAKALTELRDLVRGIHPPVLADRGLADAVRALALDSALTTEVTVDMAGTLESPLESAAYFAVSEVLTNAAKHSGAKRVWIDIRHGDGTLRITVTDDGMGGADLAGGTGLRGVERRLATFDGILALTSPAGGPTVVTLELPRELSLPKTSSS
jgi:signal transduction histidine kinase